MMQRHMQPHERKTRWRKWGHESVREHTMNVILLSNMVNVGNESHEQKSHEHTHDRALLRHGSRDVRCESVLRLAEEVMLCASRQ